MWALKILTGPLAGRVLMLKTGKNRIGRSEECDLILAVSGVSKVHAEITVLSEKVLITDLNSSNGTLLNGVRVQSGLLSPGDKVGLGPVVLDFVRVQRVAPAPAVAPAANPLASAEPAAAAASVPAVGLSEKFKNYLNQAVLPGIYRLGETFELRWILLGMVAMYVILVTLLSMVPMKQITSESIQSESRRRALTIARALAQSNERVLRSGEFSAFSTDTVLREEGIEDVYVVSREGNLLAPSERVGSSPKEIGFIRSIRGQTREVTDMVGSRVAAAVPVVGYDPELQQNTARAYAVVIYNPGGLSFNDGRAFSLFVQMLFLALLLGSVLFFLMWNLIQQPLRSLIYELNSAMHERKDHVEVKFRDSSLQSLLTIVNSLLVRVMSVPLDSQSAPMISRENEMVNLASLFAYPTLILNPLGRIIKANSAFESLLALAPSQLDAQNLASIPDQAMQKNIESLIQTAGQNPETLSQDRLELSGHFFRLSCQALRSSTGDIEFYVVTISPEDGSQGSAA